MSAFCPHTIQALSLWVLNILVAELKTFYKNEILFFEIFVCIIVNTAQKQHSVAKFLV